MTDKVLDAIRRVDPYPDHMPGPPIEMVLGRLPEHPADPAPPRARSRRRRLATATAILSGLVTASVAALALVLLGHAHRVDRPAGLGHRPPTVLACRSEVRIGVLPGWARAGFSEARPRMRYELGASGRIAAIPFGTLNSPPAADHTNKILWVSHVVPRSGGSLRILAQRMTGTRRDGTPVMRVVTGGPGPSIINLPSPGCWRLTLRWSGWSDQLDLQYNGRAKH
ncbi:MAG TPA: hypothetical protein VHW96_20830 [Solirubrobacteraceae bacterium]|jgi:hypothetical protein|nr:hypothetical protein [Solirubrobacteraceae bacterium]